MHKLCKTCGYVKPLTDFSPNRGLLCTKCNMGLGYFNDDQKLLLAAVEYLKNV